MKQVRCAAALIFFFGMIAGAQKAAGDYIVYIGSDTNTTAKGIYAARFDSTTGSLGVLDLVAEDVSILPAIT
jgi:hypothetical protein